MADLENYQKIERTTLTTEETAKYLGVSYWLVGQMVRKNEIPQRRAYIGSIIRNCLTGAGKKRTGIALRKERQRARGYGASGEG